MFAYAYPPLWPTRHWYTELFQLHADFPRKLPVQAHQPKHSVNHQNPEVFNLTVWLLSTEVLKRMAFLNKLNNYFQPYGQNVLRKTTPARLACSVACIVQRKLIPILPL